GRAKPAKVNYRLPAASSYRRSARRLGPLGRTTIGGVIWLSNREGVPHGARVVRSSFTRLAGGVLCRRRRVLRLGRGDARGALGSGQRVELHRPRPGVGLLPDRLARTLRHLTPLQA